MALVNNQRNKVTFIPSGSKIRVFISSICGDHGKYDHIRSRLKELIDNTRVAECFYTFEDKGAATLPAGFHYEWALRDSDVCVFIIDNKDGITNGVQKEIDIVKKYNIKALYYFCDEHSEEKTALEQSLMGAQYAKSKTIHKFEDLCYAGAQDLFDDIVTIYHYYCAGRIDVKEDIDENNLQKIETSGLDQPVSIVVPKSIFKNTFRSRRYLFQYIIGVSKSHILDDNDSDSNEIDGWCEQFLSVLFDRKSIKEFNVGMFLDSLKNQQETEFHNIVEIRWKAIQAYFSNDVSTCLVHLEEALNTAINTKQPLWIINDIRIDIRNGRLKNGEIQNVIDYYPLVQKEIDESQEMIYVPFLDRIHNSLNEKYIQKLYGKKIESPYTMTIGNNLKEYADLLADSLIASMYMGSLSHILLFPKTIKYFLFFMVSKYDEWDNKRDLLKFALYERQQKELTKILDAYPEILNAMGTADAIEIMQFCDNMPLFHDRFIAKMLAFGTVGYYLPDQMYLQYEKSLLAELHNWIEDENHITCVGSCIFDALTNVAYRMKQNDLAEICCSFMEKGYSRWYLELFKFMAHHLNLTKMSEDYAKALIRDVIAIIQDDNQREQIGYRPDVLWSFRKQNRELTADLDQAIKKWLPVLYTGVYKMETENTENEGLNEFIDYYTQQIQNNNEFQGKNGVWAAHAAREIAIIRQILLETKEVDQDRLDRIVSAVTDTILESKEDIKNKSDAISLLICVAFKFPECYERNKGLYDNIEENQRMIQTNDFLFSNIDRISLEISLQLLFTFLGRDTYTNLLNLFPLIQNDIATSVSVSDSINEYLELDDSIVFPSRIETIILQVTLQWLHSDNNNLRWSAARILLMLLRNPENRGVINHQLLLLMDSEGTAIKNLIIRNMNKEGITESTRDYIVQKGKNDPNYVVRKVCKDVLNGE